MNILVVGAGAMGSLFAGKLATQNVSVTMYNRPNEHTEQIKEKGLTLIKKNGEKTHVSFPVITHPTELRNDYDLIVILVKSFATKNVLTTIRSVINQDTIVLSLQNGLGNLENIQAFVPVENICIGTTGSGAGIVANGVIEQRAFGKTHIGKSVIGEEKITKFASLLSASGLKTEIVDNVQAIIWSKLMINIAYNGITAITKLKNGDAVASSEGKHLMEQIVKEGMKVAAAEKVELLYEDPIKECIRIGYEDISANKSSMLTDILLERRTEIEQINGAIVRLGKKHGIPTPYNETITQLVKMIENSYEKRVTTAT